MSWKDMIFDSEPTPTASKSGSPEKLVRSAPVRAASPRTEAPSIESVLNSNTAYTSFASTFDALDSIPDQSVRFSTALKVSTANGVAVEDIARAIDGHLLAIDAEETKAESHFNSELEERVDAKVALCKANEEQRARNTTEIKRITAENDELMTQYQQLQVEVRAEKQNLDGWKSTFLSKSTELRNKLTSIKTKLGK